VIETKLKTVTFLEKCLWSN